MKKILGLLVTVAVCSMVACNESGETAVAPSYQNPSQQPQAQNPQVDEATLYQHILDSIAAAQANSSSAMVDPFAGQLPVSSSDMMPVPVSSSSDMLLLSSSAPIAQPTSSSVVASSSSAKVTPKSSAADDGLFSLTLWDGAEGKAQVQTGNKDGGWWYSYADKLGSEITWKAELGDEGDMKPVIEACGGICGDYVIGSGGAGDYPYLGFAFGYGKNASVTGDATAIKGICVTYSYSGTATFAIELGMTSAQEEKLGSALPMVELTKGTEVTKDFAWSDFEQPTWATTTMTGPNAAKQLSSIKFKFADGKGGESGSFTIYKVGPMGACK